jgi:hypothetical protein
MRPNLKLSRRKALYLTIGGLGFAMVSCNSPAPAPEASREHLSLALSNYTHKNQAYH